MGWIKNWRDKSKLKRYMEKTPEVKNTEWI
jgi:hypothetical protein